MHNLQRFLLAVTATAAITGIAACEPVQSPHRGIQLGVQPAQAWQPAPPPRPANMPEYIGNAPWGSPEYNCLVQNYPNIYQVASVYRWYNTNQYRWESNIWGGGRCVRNSQTPRG